MALHHDHRNCKHRCYALNRALIPNVDLDRVKELVESANLRVCGPSLVYKAVTHNCSVDVLKSLLDPRVKLQAKDSSGNTVLHHAIQRNCEPKIIDLLLKHGSSGCVKNNSGQTPLHLAVLFDRNLDVLNILLGQKRSAVNFKDKRKDIPLHYVASIPFYDIQKLQALVFAGSKGLTKNERGRTPLHVSAFYGSDAIVAELFRYYSSGIRMVDNDGHTVLNLAEGKCSDLTIQQLNMHEKNPYAYIWNGLTPLHALATSGILGPIVAQYLYLVPQINVSDRDGCLPIHMALENGCSFEVFQCLISMGSKVTKCRYKQTCLHLAATGGCDVKVFEKLLASNCGGVNDIDEFHRVPLQIALKKGCSIEVFQCLVDAGSDIRRTSLHRAVRYKSSSSILRALILAGSDVTERDNFGYTPLHLALKHNCPNFVAEELLKYMDLRKNPQNFGIKNNSYLHFAINHNSRPEIIQALIKAGADVTRRNNDGNTPLHLAVLKYISFPADAFYYRHPDPIIRALIEAGGNVVGRNIESNTPLHLAVLNSHPACVKELLRGHVPNFNMKNNYGKTALMIANEKENVEVGKFLVKYATLKDSQFVRQFYDTMSTELKEFSIRCEKDLEKLKKFIVSGTTSMFDLILDNYHNLYFDKRPWVWPDKLQVVLKESVRTDVMFDRYSEYRIEMGLIINMKNLSRVFNLRLYTHCNSSGKRIVLDEDSSLLILKKLPVRCLYFAVVAFVPNLWNPCYKRSIRYRDNDIELPNKKKCCC